MFRRDGVLFMTTGWPELARFIQSLGGPEIKIGLWLAIRGDSLFLRLMMMMLPAATDDEVKQ